MLEQLAANAAMAGATYALVACGFNVAFRVLGYYYVVFGALIAIAGTACHWAAVDLGLPWVVASGVGLAAAAVIALADHLVVYRPLSARKATGLGLFLASTAAYFLLANGLLIVAGPEPRAFPTAALGVIQAGGARLPVTGLVLVVGTVAIWLGLLACFSHTRLGLAMRAVADNAEMAAVVGIPVLQTRLVAIILAAAIAGAAGTLIGLNQSVRFNMGMPLLLKGILASVVAGLGNVSLAALAGLVVGVLEVALVAALPSGLKDVFLFSLLAILLVVRPNGLLSRPTRGA